MLQRRGGSLAVTEASAQPLPAIDTSIPTPSSSTYSNVSSYRTSGMEIQLYGSSVKEPCSPGTAPIPVFGDGDQVSGKIILDPSCSQSGSLTIAVEGVFKYSRVDPVKEHETSLATHRFYTSTVTLPISPTSETFPRFRVKRERSLASIRSAISPKSPSSPIIQGDRAYPFNFTFPKASRQEEELPPSFSSIPGNPSAKAAEGQPVPTAGSFAVEYTVVARWRPSNPSEISCSLDVPIWYQPDHGFCSLDGSPEHDSWLEMPLKSDRPLPMKCAVTLPTSVTFSRRSSIPYFVVFSTVPKSPSLAREIAADATISVSVVRQISVSEPIVLPPSPPVTPTASSGDENDTPKTKLFKRVRGRKPSHTPKNHDDGLEIKDKPLPSLPHSVWSNSLCLHTVMSLGFPKRPRSGSDAQRRHPTIEEQLALPDGLQKSKILLNPFMVPSIDWVGLNIKYYLDVSVLVGPDELRARIPIRIT